MDKEIIFEKTDKPIKGGVLLPHLIKLNLIQIKNGI